MHKSNFIVFFSLCLYLFFTSRVVANRPFYVDEKIKKKMYAFFEKEKYFDGLLYYLDKKTKDSYRYKKYFEGLNTLLQGNKKKGLALLTKDREGLRNYDPYVYLAIGEAYLINYRYEDALDFFSYVHEKSPELDEILEIGQRVASIGHLLKLKTKELVVFTVTHKEKIRIVNDYSLLNYVSELTKEGQVFRENDYASAIDRQKKYEPWEMIVNSRGNRLYYVSYGDGKSKKDIYEVKNPQLPRHKKIRKVTELSTLEDEDHPMLSPDGNTLYFSSKGFGSVGGYDIFKAEYDKTLGRFKKPENIGLFFNSSSDDILFFETYYGEYCLITNRENEGYFSAYYMEENTFTHVRNIITLFDSSEHVKLHSILWKDKMVDDDGGSTFNFGEGAEENGVEHFFKELGHSNIFIPIFSNSLYEFVFTLEIRGKKKEISVDLDLTNLKPLEKISYSFHIVNNNEIIMNREIFNSTQSDAFVQLEKMNYLFSPIVSAYDIEEEIKKADDYPFFTQKSDGILQHLFGNETNSVAKTNALDDTSISVESNSSITTDSLYDGISISQSDSTNLPNIGEGVSSVAGVGSLDTTSLSSVGSNVGEGVSSVAGVGGLDTTSLSSVGSNVGEGVSSVAGVGGLDTTSVSSVGSNVGEGVSSVAGVGGLDTTSVSSAGSNIGEGVSSVEGVGDLDTTSLSSVGGNVGEGVSSVAGVGGLDTTSLSNVGSNVGEGVSSVAGVGSLDTTSVSSVGGNVIEGVSSVEGVGGLDTINVSSVGSNVGEGVSSVAGVGSLDSTSVSSVDSNVIEGVSSVEGVGSLDSTSLSSVGSNVGEGVSSVAGVGGLDTTSVSSVGSNVGEGVSSVAGVGGLDTTSVSSVGSNVDEGVSSVAGVGGLDTTSVSSVGSNIGEGVSSVEGVGGLDTTSLSSVGSNVGEGVSSVEGVGSLDSTSVSSVGGNVGEGVSSVAGVGGLDTTGLSSAGSNVGEGVSSVAGVGGLDTTSVSSVGSNVGEGVSSVEGVGDLDSKSVSSVGSNVGEGVSSVEGVGGLDSTSVSSVGSNVDEGISSVEGVGGLDTTSVSSVGSNVGEGVSSVEGVGGLDSTSVSSVGSNVDEGISSVEGVGGLDTTSVSSVGSNVGEGVSSVEGVGGLDTTSVSSVGSNVGEGVSSVEGVGDLDTTSVSIVGSNVSEGVSSVEGVGGLDTTSISSADSNIGEGVSSVEGVGDLDTTSVSSVGSNVGEGVSSVEGVGGLDSTSVSSVGSNVGEGVSSVEGVGGLDSTSVSSVGSNVSEGVSSVEGVGGLDKTSISSAGSNVGEGVSSVRSNVTDTNAFLVKEQTKKKIKGGNFDTNVETDKGFVVDVEEDNLDRLNQNNNIKVVQKSIFQKDKYNFYTKENPIPLNKKEEGLIYKIQLAVLKSQIPQSLFGGLYPITSVQTKTAFTKYYAGFFKTYAEAEKVKYELMDMGYGDAFIVPFFDGKTMKINEAIAEEKKGVQPKTDTAFENEKNQIDKVQFRIQLLASRTNLDANYFSSIPLEGKVRKYESNGIYRYEFGEYLSYKEASEAKKELEKIYLGAFLVAYTKDKKLSMLEAIHLEQEKILANSNEQEGLEKNIQRNNISTDGDGVEYGIQLAASRKKLPVDKVIKNIDPKHVRIYKKGEWFKYVYSVSTKDLDLIQEKKKELRKKGYINCFIVSHIKNKNDEVSLNVALSTKDTEGDNQHFVQSIKKIYGKPTIELINSTNDIFFTTQIGVFTHPVNSSLFKDIKGTIYFEVYNKKYIRYFVNRHKDFSKADADKIDIKKPPFSDAFVTAYMNGKKITIEKAKSSLQKKDIVSNIFYQVTYGYEFEDEHLPIDIVDKLLQHHYQSEVILVNGKHVYRIKLKIQDYDKAVLIKKDLQEIGLQDIVIAKYSSK